MSPPKRPPFIFWIALSKLTDYYCFWHQNFCQIFSIQRNFDVKTLQICPLHLSDAATLHWEIKKSHFQQYCSYILLIIYVISEEKNSNPLAHTTWECHHTNLWTAQLFLSDWMFVAFFQMLDLEALKRASCGLSSVALKKTGYVMWQLEC